MSWSDKELNQEDIDQTEREISELLNLSFNVEDADDFVHNVMNKVPVQDIDNRAHDIRYKEEISAPRGYQCKIEELLKHKKERRIMKKNKEENVF